MEKKLIKNVDFSTVLNMEGLVEYQEGTVVSRTLAQGKPMSMTLFAFDKGEEISTHSAGGDAMVYLLDGQADIQINGEHFNVKKGEMIVMPANIPHGLTATERFKMLLVVVFSLQKQTDPTDTAPRDADPMYADLTDTGPADL